MTVQAGGRKWQFTIEYQYRVERAGPDGKPPETAWRCVEEELLAFTEVEAQIASTADKYHVHGGKYGAAQPTRLMLSEFERDGVDGWRRVRHVQIPLPQPQHCICGKAVWPIKGEVICHPATLFDS